MVNDEVLAEIHRTNRNRLRLPLIILAISLIVAVASLCIAQVKIGFLESLRIFVDGVMGVEPNNYRDHLKMYLVFENNGPRAVGALLAGGTLAVGGAVLQNIIRNPLADPYTLGISSGAMFGMVIAVTTGISIIPFLSDSDSYTANAFICALIPTAVIVLLSVFKKVSPTMMILCGIAVMYIFSAFTTMIKFTMDAESYAQIYTWAIGTVGGLSWIVVGKMGIAFLITLIPMWAWYRNIDIIAQGDNQAITLGVNPNRMRIICLIFISLGTAIIVCYTGTIGFVGLVAPHIARRFVGSGCRYLIPASATIGGLMVLASDIVLRIFEPGLPVGVMIAMICSPVFIYILVKMKRNSW